MNDSSEDVYTLCSEYNEIEMKERNKLKKKLKERIIEAQLKYIQEKSFCKYFNNQGMEVPIFAQRSLQRAKSLVEARKNIFDCIFNK